MKLARAEQMQEIDKKAIHDIGIPGVVLMENAGKKTADLLISHYGNPTCKKVIIFAGPGNNGGDGFVIARHLQEAGARVLVYLLVEPDKIKGDAEINLSILRKLSIPHQLILNKTDVKNIRFDSCFAIVDALFGTGLKRDIKGHFSQVVQAINNASCPVIAVDIPSGLDSDTGTILGTAVHADITATYGLAKPGQYLYPGRDHIGHLEVIDIGIPSQVIREMDLPCELLSMDMPYFLPPRQANSHKGSHGHLAIIAGSLGKTGAAILTGKGALRSGAGLVSLYVGHHINTIIESSLHEAMTIPIPGGDDGAPQIEDFEQIQSSLEGKTAAVIGPGLGNRIETAHLVKKMYLEWTHPLVVDADALNLLASAPADLKNTSLAPRILTPHPGEMARLIGKTGKHVQANRLEIARNFAALHNVYLILKGAGTIIASPRGHLAINASGNAGMATGGMGDVLCGIIGGLLVQGIEIWQACCLGTFIHGLAGDVLAEKGTPGYLAGEVADMIPGLLKNITDNKQVLRRK